MNKPNTNEYPPYFKMYINLVPEGDVIRILEEQINEAKKLFYSISVEVASYRYAPEKWCIKEIVGHLSDTERIFCYRALRFARKDKTILASFDQDLYVKNANFCSRTLIDLGDEFQTSRESTLTLFRSFSDDVYSIFATTSDFSLSIRSIPYIIAGHEIHHRNIIMERYIKRNF